MNISVGDIGLFLFFIGFGIYCAKHYFSSKDNKYLFFLLGCIYGIFNRNYMISINGVEINTTIYAITLKYIILVPMTIIGYNLYKQRYVLKK